MFQSLSDKLGSVFDKLTGRGALSEDDVNAAMREIRIALLEADVALPVVKEFISNIREKAVGQAVIKAVQPGQQIVKIVHDEMIALLTADNQELNINHTPPMAILMMGLQGSGKTTSTAKISKFLTDKHRKKVLMASLDVYRPAAQEQLAQLGRQTDVATLPVIEGQNPVDIAKRAMETARKEGFDIVMLDTAGRLAIDEVLMQEVADIRDATNPVETLLVADAMTGQDAVNVAAAFEEKVGISGIMLTRVDGDSRGGAAMSMRAITGKPVKLIGVGEKWDALEPFLPDRIAGRILGMGDVVGLVEKAIDHIDQEDAKKMAEKFKKGKFDFNDMLSQFHQMSKMGGVGNLMKMLPGLSKYADKIDEANLDNTILKKQEAIIYSMTKEERSKPSLMNASRKRRIAKGSGTTVQEINKLIKQHAQMEKAMKRLKKMGMGGMMKAMKGLMGGKDAAMMENMQNMDPEELQQMMDGELPGENSPLGPNPFLNSGMASGLASSSNPFATSAGDDPFAGLPVRGGTKKNRKKKGRR